MTPWLLVLAAFSGVLSLVFLILIIWPPIAGLINRRGFEIKAWTIVAAAAWIATFLLSLYGMGVFG